MASLPVRAVAALVDTFINGVALWCVLLGATTLWPELARSSALVRFAASVTFQDLVVRLVDNTAWEVLLVPGALGLAGVVGVMQWSAIASRGASLGKALVGLHMVGPDNRPVGFFRGVLLRQWVWMGLLVVVPCGVQVLGFESAGMVLAGLGALLQLFNVASVLERQHKAIHDVLADTRVVDAVPHPAVRAVGVMVVAGGAAALWMFAAPLDVTVDAVHQATLASPGGSAPSPAVSAAPSIAAPLPPTQPAALDAGATVAAKVEPRVPPREDRTTVYKWVDAKGNVHFTQGKASIPARYRARAEAREDLSATVLPTPRDMPAAQDAVIHFKPGKHIPVDVLINGKVTAHLYLDTGADKTVIRPALLEEAGVRVADGVKAVMTGVVANQARTVPLVAVKTLQVAGHTVETLLVAAYDMEGKVDGLLGQDFLAHFSVTIDAAKGEVRLTQRPVMP